MLWSVFVLSVPTGGDPGLCILWFMYTRGPAVRHTRRGLCSGSSGWAVVPAGSGGRFGVRRGLRFWLFRLGGCASWFSSTRGGQGGVGGRLGCHSGAGAAPCLPCPCAPCWRLAGLTFLWPVAASAGGLLRASNEGLLSGSSSPLTSALAEAGGLLRTKCGGCRLLTCVVWF